ncbi:MAG: hypothetical protein GXO97_10270 [Nitrospirae bacterium]|nr:hypothetical protein [Nitrospirota bacterium]
MIPGTFLEQFFTANNSPVLSNSLNLKAPVRDDYKPMQGESVPGLYLLFNQILQNLLSGNSSVREQALSLDEGKPLVSDTIQPLAEMNNKELTLSINLLGGGNMAVPDSAGSTERETPGNRLPELHLKPDGRVSFQMVRVSEKHMQSSVRDVKSAKAIESDFPGLLGTTAGNEGIQADGKEVNLNGNMYGPGVADLLPQDSTDKKITGRHDNKSAHTVDKKIPPDILQDKGEISGWEKTRQVTGWLRLHLILKIATKEMLHKGSLQERMI